MPKIILEGNGNRTFLCPGCNETHTVNRGWVFNGNADKPTFTPSVLVRTGHYCDTGEHDHPCWCDHNKELVEKGEEPSGFECMVCHSFVTDGNIQFLSDCSHKLAGHTVELPEL